MTISEFIKNYRKTNKLSMQELANRCGVTKGYISMIEGKRNPRNNYKEIVPSITTIRKLAIGMGIDVDELLAIVDDEIVLSEKDQVETPYEKLKRELGVKDFNEQEKLQIVNYIKFIISQRKEGEVDDGR